ncbi:LysR family transcriptional regulator [Hyalangium versicolor]|uniref:LysR family transcriptional regulator n=1 Tax=Hyalangium versicolor TaxID=2861190 RepID=UPI001CCE157E|nr:LysR family transcriptional regulator [Hyalangium versicolor]
MTPIDHANLSRLDLNLLVAFDALLQERHLTRAAARIGIGQPAMSHHLGRLRELLGDELFRRSPGGMEPTPHARALAETVREVLARIQTLTLLERRFDPATDERHFRIGIPDGLEIALMPPFMAHVAREAPGVSFSLTPVDEATSLRMLDEGELDLLVGPLLEGAPHHKRRQVCSEGYLCLFHPELVRVRLPLSLDDFLALPHVRISRRADAFDVVDDALAKLRKRRRVVMHTSHSLTVPYVLRQSALLACLPRRAALTTAEAFDLAVSPPPIPLPENSIAMRWHGSRHTDAGHIWLRETLLRSAAELGAADPGKQGVARRRVMPRQLPQKSAMGLTGEPVPPSTASGATVRRKS